MSGFEDFLKQYGSGGEQATEKPVSRDSGMSGAPSPAAQQENTGEGVGQQPRSSYEEFLRQYGGRRQQQAPQASPAPGNSVAEAPSPAAEAEASPSAGLRPSSPAWGRTPSPLRDPGNRLARVQDDITQQQVQTPQKSFASDPFGFLFNQPKQAQQQTEEAKQPIDPTAEAGRGKALPGGQRMETIDPGRLTQKANQKMTGEIGEDEMWRFRAWRAATGGNEDGEQSIKGTVSRAFSGSSADDEPATGREIYRWRSYELNNYRASVRDQLSDYSDRIGTLETEIQDIERFVADDPSAAQSWKPTIDQKRAEIDQLERERSRIFDEITVLEQREKDAFARLSPYDREAISQTWMDRVVNTTIGTVQKGAASYQNAIASIGAYAGENIASYVGIGFGLLQDLQDIYSRTSFDGGRISIAPSEDPSHIPFENAIKGYGQRYAFREAYARDVFDPIDKLNAKGVANIDLAHDDVGFLGGLALDVYSGALDILFDTALNAVAPGSFIASMLARSYGASSMEARQKGADPDAAILYGLKGAAIEYATEKIAGLGHFHGEKGLIDGWLESGIEKFVSRGGNELFARMLIGFGSEGMEEALSDVFNYGADYCLSLMPGGKFDFVDPSFDFGDMLYDFLVGGLLGTAGSSVDYSAKNSQSSRSAQNTETASKARTIEVFRESGKLFLNLEIACDILSCAESGDAGRAARLVWRNQEYRKVYELMFGKELPSDKRSLNAQVQQDLEALRSEMAAESSEQEESAGGRAGESAKPYTAVDALTGVDPRARQSGAEERIATPATQSPVRNDEGTEGRNATEPSAPGHDAVSAQEAAGASLAQGGTETAGHGAQASTEQAPVLNSNEGAENKTAPVGADESTVVNTNPAQHTAAEQRVIDEYQDAVDENLVSYIETVQNNPGAKLGRYSLKPVNDRAAADIQKITGVNVTGNKTAIEPRIVEHILKDHGPAGRTDQSMRDVNDIGRIQYVLDNYDSVSDGGTTKAYQTVKGNGLPGQAKTVVFEKAVNGTYYVVEAVPDTKAKTLFVVSAYMSKKSPGAQQTADANASRVTSETKNADTPGALEAPASNSNIARLPANINTQNALSQERAGQAAAPTTQAPTDAPSQQNIDNTANPAYNNTEKTAGGNTNVEGRSAEEAGRGVAPGENVLGKRDRAGRGSGGSPESSGVVRVSPELQRAYEASGVVEYGLEDSSGDSAAYSSALDAGRNSDPEHGWMVTPQTAEELQGKALLLARNGSIGVVITKDGDIEGVFKNKQTGRPGALMTLLPQAIEHGGNKLDCYGVGLVTQYAQYGFVPVARVEFNEEYANPGWDPSKGRPDVFIMVHNGDSADTVVRKHGNYPKVSQAELDALPRYGKNGYDDAIAYRDDLLSKQNGQNRESGLPGATTHTGTPSVTAANRSDSSLAEGATGETGLAPRDPSAALRSAQDDAMGETGEGRIATEPPAPRNDTSGQKRSKTESHTEQHIAGRLGGEQEAVYYTPKSERESLTNAINRVNSDFNGEVQRLSDKPMWTGEDIDTALTIYGFLQMDGVRTGDFSAAQAWGRLVSARGTESGRALQAFSKWTRTGAAAATQSMERLLEAKRLSEEDRTRITNDVYNFAQEYDSIEDGDFGSLRDLIKRQARYRNTWTFLPKEFERMLNEETDFDWLKEYALRQMMNISADFTEQADLGQKVKTWQVNAQLSRLGTFFRNLGGNAVFGVQDTVSQDFFGVALDALVGKMTGKRTLSMDKGWLSSEARRGARRGMVRSILEVAGDVDMSAGGSKYGQSANRTFKMTGGGFSRMMSRWEQALGYSLTTSDRTFRGGIEAEQLRGLSQFENLTEEERQQLAENMADYRLFQNQGLAYRLMKGAHDVGNVLGYGGKMEGMQRKGGFGAADLVMPYPGVPANLWAKALEYSPANIVKGGVQLLKLLHDAKTGKDWNITRQQNAVMNVARGLHGTGLVALLAAMFSAGIFHNADDEDDKDVLALLSAQGRQGVQLNLSAGLRWLSGKDAAWQDGDQLMKIDWLEPMNAFMAIAALAADEDDFPGYVGATLEGSLQAVLDMPLMENIANIVDTYNYSKADSTAGKLIDTAVGFGADALTGFLPAFLSQTARAMDPYYRETVGDDPLDTAKRRLFNTIPGLRQTLPEKLDNFGRPKEQAESAYNRWMNSFVRPGQISDYKTGEMEQELEAFVQRTGDKDAVPARKAPNSFGKGENQITMTADEKRLYQQVYGQSCEELYSSILLGDDYKDLSDGEKQWLLEQARDYATHQAKQAVLSGRGESREDKTWDRVDRVAKAGVDPVDYLLGKKQADRDEDGSTSKREVFDWLFTSDYTNAQKRAIWKETGGTDGSSWDQYRDNHPAAILASYKIDGDRAIAIATEINGGKTDWNGVKDLSSDELYAYYRKHPEQERYVKRLYDKKGLSESWDELKASQERTPVNILVYGHGYSQKDAERLWKDINTNGGNVTQAEFYAFYRNHPELRDELEDIWKSKWPKTDIGRYRPR